MQIGDTPVEEGSVYFIAEAGVNHNGDVDRATDLVDAAVEAGADAVKFQTYDSDRLVAADAPKAAYQDEQAGADLSQRDMIAQFELTDAEHEHLVAYARDAGITFLSTPFDARSVELLDDLDLAAIKVGSGELTNHPLLAQIARLGRPMVVSTGMATLDEVVAAREVVADANPEVTAAFLHCVSAYPTETADVNLRAMATLDDAVPGPVGFSDHTMAVETPGFAVAAGAKILEKHLTLDRSLPGPDHEASLEPDELARAVTLARQAATARGTPGKEPVPAETDNRDVVRRSLHAAADVERGETITDDAVSILRPAAGLPPSAYESVVGREAARDLAARSPITAADVRGVDGSDGADGG